MSNCFCLGCLKKKKKRCNFVLAYFPKRKWKEGKEKKQHKGKKDRKKDVCLRQPSNALTGHWAWTAGSCSGNWLCPGVFQEMPELNCCGKYFPDRDHPFKSCCKTCLGCSCDSAALCSTGVGNKGVPEAALAAQERFALGNRRKGFTWQESRDACATLQGGMHSHLKEKSRAERDVSPGAEDSFAFCWRTNSAKVLNLQLTSLISWLPFGCSFSCRRRPRFSKQNPTIGLEIYIYFHNPHILPVQSPVLAFSFLVDISWWSICLNQSRTKMCRHC